LKSINVVLNPDGSIDSLSQNKLYVEEHACAQLVIELAGELAAQDIEYHVISFLPTGTNKKSSTQNIYALDPSVPDTPDAYLSDGKLYCTLPFELCSQRSLSMQVEAHKQTNGKPSYISKSAIFNIGFETSLTGVSEYVSSDVYEILPSIHALLSELKSVVQSTIVQAIISTEQEITLNIPLYVPTPELTDNSDKAATTAFVQCLLEEIFSDLDDALSEIIGGD
jgi:hypothetical protein